VKELLPFVIYKFDPDAVIPPTLPPLSLTTPLRVNTWPVFAVTVLVPLRPMLREIVSATVVPPVVVPEVRMLPKSMIEFPPTVKFPKVPAVAFPVLEKVIFPIDAPGVKVLVAVTVLLPVKMRLFVAVLASACVIATPALRRDVDQFPLVLEVVLFQVKLPAAWAWPEKAKSRATDAASNPL
jgi:hypothetical protein